uniref:Inorganic pyrophosphatase n=1 Tax=Strigamia maritima TaxID=126957 RepID=T1IWU8_STRMM
MSVSFLRHVCSAFPATIRCALQHRYLSLTHRQLQLTMYRAIERGSFNTPSYRIYFKDDKGTISPFHDIPLFADEGNSIFNMVVEVPRWTNAKMEINTKEAMNPISQDTKKEKLRFVHNCFPHHGYIWNYGALPQTWENPESIDEATKCKGDNDPIDVCEIGQRVAKRGDVLQVKILGTMALIDEGETDWKLLAIDVNDPLADSLNDVADIEKIMPGFLRATHEWFRIYKMPDGKPENKFAFNGEAKNKEFALKIIQETHQYWKNLIKNAQETNLDRTNVTVDESPYKVSREDADSHFDKSDEPAPPTDIDSSVNKWHYVRLT